ncbi:DUF1289 domain-containing protein [Marinagarivorans cellulosilyticus]|uniref:DUF1289 domain-containing protein n=1 Tax=Marinagarivorans cellulosilyticus TaxID=2721545 RepID=UPI001F3794D0|nr:DUF1289 domain-containing protein [Marinagarivorans cellulosilyticus]
MTHKLESESEDVPSPCIKKCCLDDNNLCIGCYRTLEDITGWREKTALQKKDILQCCAQRKAQYKSHCL